MVAAGRLVEVVVVGGTVPMVIWAIELVKVLELAVSALLCVEDSDQLRVRVILRMRSNSFSTSPICFRMAVISPGQLG